MSESSAENETNETVTPAAGARTGGDRIPVLTERAAQAQTEPATNDDAPGDDPPLEIAPLDDEAIAAIAERVLEDVTPRLRAAVTAALERHLAQHTENRR